MTVEKAQRFLGMFSFSFHLLPPLCLPCGFHAGSKSRRMSLTHDGVEMVDFTLTYFLSILHSLTAGWCAIFTQQPSWIIRRHLCSGVWCVWNSQYHHALHTLIFLQCSDKVIDLERQTDRRTHSRDIAAYSGIWDSFCCTLWCSVI